MPTLHLIFEAKYSEVALKKRRATNVPTNLWSLCGALPGDIELDEPNPIMVSRGARGRLRTSGLWSYLTGLLSAPMEPPVRYPDHLMHDLAYDEFLLIKSCSEARLISENIPSGFSAVQAMLAVKEFARTIGYEVYLYETCDY